ncbi:MAG: CBS domain-containing protein [Thiotrichaceae bacterium]|nr:CBS domain-containing protein [Thiotrichaceae bacterium]
MKVEEIMTTGVKTTHADTSVKEAANIMCLNNISGLPVVDDDNNIIGIVSEKDVLRKMFPKMDDIVGDAGVPNFENMEQGYTSALGLKVSDIMSSAVASVSADMPIMKAASLMCLRQIRRIPVTKGNKLVGIVSIGDVHKAIYQQSLT